MQLLNSRGRAYVIVETHVSPRPMVRSRKGVRKAKPRVDMAPAPRPTVNAPAKCSVLQNSHDCMIAQQVRVRIAVATCLSLAPLT